MEKHNHDDRYYTKADTNTLIGNKVSGELKLVDTITQTGAWLNSSDFSKYKFVLIQFYNNSGCQTRLIPRNFLQTTYAPSAASPEALHLESVFLGQYCCSKSNIVSVYLATGSTCRIYGIN